MNRLLGAAAIAALLAVATGCAHSSRLPECKGTSTPINVPENRTERRP